MTLAVVILAGGLATRLRPLTETIPKSMVDVLGAPFLAHQLALLKTNGVQEIFLCLGYLGEQVEAYLKVVNYFDLKIHCYYDGGKLLGTAGAIRRIWPELPAEFMVVYGDSYLPCDYQAAEKVFHQSGKQGLMSVFHNQGLWDKSNVVYEKGEIIVYDKKTNHPQMKYIDYGLGVFKKDVFANLPIDEPYDLALVYEDLLKKKQLAAFEVYERFYEVGSFSGIKDLEHYLSQSKKV